ncbi:MAG: endonuclease/exonuclease/phosphatase family protein [Pseudomonadota bacterium]
MRIATFNVKNLTTPGNKIYFGREPLYTEAEYAEKTWWIGQRLLEMDADVVGFQEIWKVDAIMDCLREVGLEDEYDVFGRDAPNNFSVQVATMVRKGTARSEMTWHEQFPEDARFIKRRTEQSTYHMDVQIDNFSRPVLELTIKPKRRGSSEITFFNAHLKSKRPIDLDRPERDKLPSQDEAAIGSALSTIRRSAEAAALRMVLNKRMLDNDDPVVVLGDLNDDYLSVSTTIVTGDPSYKLFEASRVGARRSKSADLGLYSVQMLKQYRSLRNVHYTHIFRNRIEVLDHILVSEQFYDHSLQREWAFRDAKYFNDHLEDEANSHVTTDHGIVLAEFDFKPIAKEVHDAAAIV